MARPQPLAVGLAALMQAPEREALYVACQRRLAALEHERALDEAALFLLQNLVRTYIDLSAEERARVLARLEAEGDNDVKTSELTWAERTRAEGQAQGRAEGQAQGRAEGQAEAILIVLRERFGAAPPAVEARIRAERDATALGALLVRALRVASPDDL